MELAELMGIPGNCLATALRMVFWPSEITPLIGTGSASVTSRNKAEILLRTAEQSASQQHLA